ncbi:MAG: glycerol kinase GlpK [Candidatus Hodarchaeales archaeon]
MEENYIGAVDQGTTGTRFMIFDHQSNLISSYYKEHEQIFPQPGWVEHNPLEIWKNTEIVINESLKRAKLSINDLSAIGITNQRETAILWNKKTGIPVHNAIVWQCTRTENICDALKDGGYENFIRNKTGLVPATYFSGPKIKWILDHKDFSSEIRNQELLFGNIDSWIIWNLTGGVDGGVHVTDSTNASRTMLMDLKTLNWDTELLNIIGVPEHILPEIRPSSDSEIYGYLKFGLFRNETPVSGDLGDQQAALFGQTCFEKGEAKNTYGTGNFLLLNTGSNIIESKTGLLTTVGYTIESDTTYSLEGSVAISGAAIQWLRDQLCIITSAEESEILAQSVNDNGGVYFVPAFVGLFSPHWDSTARGTIFGLTRGSNKAHITRAALESIAYQSFDVFQSMEKDSKVKLQNLKVDGGASKNNLLIQFQSDILGINCIRPKIEETTALGAAYAAGLAIGYWKSMNELKENRQIDRTFFPQMTTEKRSELLRNWNKAVEKAKGWI